MNHLISATEHTARWYALYTRSRFEKKIDDDFRRRGIECFLPLVEEVRLWSDRKKKVLEPLFRGYIFVRTDLRNKVSILQTDGIVRFVGVRNTPSPVPEHQINWVRILAGSPDAIRREEYVSVGEVVRITAGQFKGVEGFVMKVKDTARVAVSLSCIAQSVSVEVPQEFLERIDQPVAEPSIGFIRRL